MELYANPILTTSRPILLFVAENDCSFVSVNPNGLVPLLVHGELRLTKTAGILRYLADFIQSPAYPVELVRRERIGERMNWITAHFHRSFGSDLIYAQIHPEHRRAGDRPRVTSPDYDACEWLRTLDDELAGQAFLCGDAITIADYLGAPYVSVGAAFGCNLSSYPHIRRWLATMRGLRSWRTLFGEDFATSAAPTVALRSAG